jgi:hypothetical protein
MIEMVFKELERWGVVSSGADFSRSWLGMEESYWRCLKAKRRPPSTVAIVNCAARLRRKAQLLEQSSLPEAKRAAQRMNALANQCVDELLSASEGAT